MNGHARPCNIRRQRRSSHSVLRRSVESAANSRHSRRCPMNLGTTAFNTTRTLRTMFNSRAYLDRAAPHFAREKFLALAFTRELFIELAPGSNCPGRIFWPGRSASPSSFLTFCAAFAFARRRALSLVMSSSPFEVALWRVIQPKERGHVVKLRIKFRAHLFGSPPLGLPCHATDWSRRRGSRAIAAPRPAHVRAGVA